MVRRHLTGRVREIVSRAATPAVVALSLLMSRMPALAGDAPTEPFLRLGTDMHTAAISAISVDATAHRC